MRVSHTIDVTGRRIYLTRERWKHIIEHGEMAHSLERIEQTLRAPSFIRPSDCDEQVQYYARHFKDGPAKYLLVALKYLNGEGFIITAFYTNHVR